jgi:hypothetical protein
MIAVQKYREAEKNNGEEFVAPTLSKELVKAQRKATININ